MVKGCLGTPRLDLDAIAIPKIALSKLRVDLGEKYTKSCNAQIAESDQMGWYGVVPSSDTLWYSSWALGAPGAELGHF